MGRILNTNVPQCIRPGKHEKKECHSHDKHHIAEHLVDMRRRIGAAFHVEMRDFRLKYMSILLKHLAVPSGVAVCVYNKYVCACVCVHVCESPKVAFNFCHSLNVVLFKIY